MGVGHEREKEVASRSVSQQAVCLSEDSFGAGRITELSLKGHPVWLLLTAPGTESGFGINLSSFPCFFLLLLPTISPPPHTHVSLFFLQVSN